MEAGTTERKAVRAVISGRVQGVWFRAWTQEQAEAQGLDGWVRNRSDGTVEAVFAGPADALEAMLARCRQGPPRAVVLEVEAAPWSRTVEPGFRQLPTA